MKCLTKTRLGTARRCMREHKIVFIDGYRPAEEAKPLFFGSLIHAGLEAIWKGSVPEWPANADPFDVAKARPMLAGYAARWDPSLYEVLGVEQEFRCPLVNPATGVASRTWELAGKLDAVVREKSTGRMLAVEHKTSSEDFQLGSTYMTRLALDTQVSVYFCGAKSLGYDVAGMLYDVLGKPGLQPKQIALTDADGVKIVHDDSGARVMTKDGKKWRETGSSADGYILQTRDETAAEFEARVASAIMADPEFYYARGEVVRLEKEMSDAMVDVWDSAKIIHEAETAGRAPRNPDACKQWGRMCSFFPVCSGAETIENKMLYTHSENLHPELSGESSQPAKEPQ